jgi:hypothetical protein
MNNISENQTIVESQEIFRNIPVLDEPTNEMLRVCKMHDVYVKPTISGEYQDSLYLSAPKEIDSDVFMAVQKAGWRVTRTQIDVTTYTKNIKIGLEVWIDRVDKRFGF